MLANLDISATATAKVDSSQKRKDRYKGKKRHSVKNQDKTKPVEIVEDKPVEKTVVANKPVIDAPEAKPVTEAIEAKPVS